MREDEASAVLCDGSLRGRGDLSLSNVGDGVRLQETTQPMKRDPVCLAETLSFHLLPAHTGKDLAT